MNVISLGRSTIRITGKVIDDLRNPLPGANIFDPSNTIVGTTTDLDGNFSVDVGYMATIKISYMGFDSKTFRAGSIPKTIQLMPSDNRLNEIVLTAKKPKALSHIFKTTGSKIGLAALFLGGLMLFTNPKKSSKGLKGYAKVAL